jgi:cell division septation protein DedD
LGIAYFKQQKYEHAEKQYLVILDKYNQYEELNLVYLKLGQTYEMEKKPKQAYAAYWTLADRFPKSLEVSEAKGRMEELAKADPELAKAFAVPTEAPTQEVVVQATPSPAMTETVEPTPTELVEKPTQETALKLTPYHVQVGVYTAKVNVTKAQKAIKKAGYKSYVVTVQKEGEAYTYYKVRVGNFATKSAAQKVAKILHKKTKEKAIVVED